MTHSYDRQAAIAHLRAADPILARIIEAVGPFTMEPQSGAFRMLTRAIFFQQLAGPAARAIMTRVLAVIGADETSWYHPEQFLAASEDQLRAAGLSRQKLTYLRDAAAKFATGQLSDNHFLHLSDEDVIKKACSIKGIGRWTAEMFLIFSLDRPDVLPVDDLGIRRAMQAAYGLPGLPKPDEMRAIAGPWQPYRTAGTWYMWRSLGVELPENGR